jgi:hypothetical protein
MALRLSAFSGVLLPSVLPNSHSAIIVLRTVKPSAALGVKPFIKRVWLFLSVRGLRMPG